jgi:hypothetical protein
VTTDDEDHGKPSRPAPGRKRGRIGTYVEAFFSEVVAPTCCGGVLAISAMTVALVLANRRRLRRAHTHPTHGSAHGLSASAELGLVAFRQGTFMDSGLRSAALPWGDRER